MLVTLIKFKVSRNIKLRNKFIHKVIVIFRYVIIKLLVYKKESNMSDAYQDFKEDLQNLANSLNSEDVRTLHQGLGLRVEKKIGLNHKKKFIKNEKLNEISLGKLREKPSYKSKAFKDNNKIFDKANSFRSLDNKKKKINSHKKFDFQDKSKMGIIRYLILAHLIDLSLLFVMTILVFFASYQLFFANKFILDVNLVVYMKRFLNIFNLSQLLIVFYILFFIYYVSFKIFVSKSMGQLCIDLFSSKNYIAINPKKRS